MSLELDATIERDGFRVNAAFTAEPGRLTTILGPNGSGKSTLLLAIAGLLSASRGFITLDRRPLDTADTFVPPRERHLGMVFQDGLLLPHRSVANNVAFPLRARGTERRSAGVAALAALDHIEPGLAGLAERNVRDLSGGERQKVALARALIGEPRALLLDEPLSALDVASRLDVREILGRAVDSFTGPALLVTHDPVEAMTMSDHIVIVEEGRVVQIGSPSALRNAPATRFVADLVGRNLFTGTLETLPDGSSLLSVHGGGTIVMASPSKTPTGAITATLAPADIEIHTASPEGSARNAIEGTIRSITADDDRVRLRLDTVPALVADITRGSFERMGLRPGARVWASFKAVEVRSEND